VGHGLEEGARAHRLVEFVRERQDWQDVTGQNKNMQICSTMLGEKICSIAFGQHW
jgi:hypothetical protein